MKKAKIGIAILTSVMVVSLIFGGMALAKPSFEERDFDDEDEYVADELIVKFKGDEKPFRVVKLPRGKSVREAKREFELDDDVEYAEPNYIAHAFMVPDDTYYSYQWHLDDQVEGGNPYGGANGGGINVEPAWDVSTGSGVTVAIIDTGIAYEDYERYEQAPDLAGTLFAPGYDFVNNDTHPNDDNGHGTHVTGTVAQTTNNALGVAGIAFNATIMPVKVLDKRGSGTYANVANGIIWATDHGAQIINLSLGGSADSLTLENAVAYAYNNGVTVVAAAGNDGTNVISYPAAYDAYVIAVGATRYDETLSYYSNYGSSLDIVAPGGDLRVDQNSDGYGDGVLQQTFGRKVDDFGYYFYQGTSMASPHAAGTAALVIANGVTGPDNVRAALETTAEDLGAAGWDATYGWGLVDAAAALAYVPGPVDNPPTVSITSPLDGAVVSGIVEITADATDDVGVVQVDFYVDEAFLGSDASEPYSWSWDSTSVADGTYTLTATALDTTSQTASDSISVLVDNVNDPPVADAGPDQTVSDSDGNGVESVTLDGSGSYDPDGTITAWKWTEGDTVLGEAEVITYDFAVGTHTVTLTVTDDGGLSGSDTAVVTVTSIPAMEVTITKHDARYRWDKKNSVGKIEVQIDFQVDAGSSSQVVLKEVTDPVGTWSLGSSEVVVKISGVRYIWPLSLDANKDATIDFEAQGITLSAGDVVQISKMKLLNDSQGSHSLTAQVFEAGNLIADDSLGFSLESKGSEEESEEESESE